MRKDIDPRSEFLARQAEVLRGGLDMQTALEWWNRGWVAPASFDPIDWKITPEGQLLLDRASRSTPAEPGGAQAAAAAADRPEPPLHRFLQR